MHITLLRTNTLHHDISDKSSTPTYLCFHTTEKRESIVAHHLYCCMLHVPLSERAFAFDIWIWKTATKKTNTSFIGLSGVFRPL